MKEFAEDDERLPQLQNIAEDCHNKWKNTLTVLDYKRKSNETLLYKSQEPKKMSFVDGFKSLNCLDKGRGR